MINVVVTQAVLDFCKMQLFQGGKCLENIYTHSAFKIRTDKAYVSPGLIKWVLISSVYVLL